MINTYRTFYFLTLLQDPPCKMASTNYEQVVFSFKKYAADIKAQYEARLELEEELRKQYKARLV